MNTKTKMKTPLLPFLFLIFIYLVGTFGIVMACYNDYINGLSWHESAPLFFLQALLALITTIAYDVSLIKFYSRMRVK